MDATVVAHRETILHLAHKHGARAVRVFGSAARGKVKAGSDIDILVVMDSDRSLLDRIALQQDLEDALGRPVDVVNEAALPARIRDRVLEETIALEGATQE
jgi:predicted nucleotidyltransferase